MSVEWTIKYGDVEKTPAEWGVKNLSCRFRIGIEAVDDFTFFRPCKKAEVESMFAIDSTLILYRAENGQKVKWFEGLVIDDDCDIGEQAEGQGYNVVGPGYYLDNHIFKQIWKSYTGDPDNLAEVRVSRVMLGTKVAVNELQRQHMRDQITEILDYAKLCGAPLDYDVTDVPAIFLPTDELLDRYCSEAIKRQLRLVPDLVLRWDYTVSPPKLIFKKRDNIAPVTLPATDGIKFKGLRIKECFDLRRPSVVIRYEVTNVDNGFEWKQFQTDRVPGDATGDELHAFMKTVDLQGFSRTTSAATLESSPIVFDGEDWWKAHVNWLNSEKVKKITLSNPQRSGVLLLPYELTEGTFPPWLTEQNYSYEQETISVNAVVEFDDGSKREEMLSVDVNATDAETGTYIHEDTFNDPELIPVGLAQELYNAVNRREFKGTRRIVEQECSGELLAGYTFNLSGGRDVWATMKALVNEVEADIDGGKTSFQFGPPPYLGLDEAIELLRQNRTRWIYTFGTQRATGKIVDSRIDMPKTSAKKNTASGVTGHQRLVVKTDVSDSLTGNVDIDAAKAIHDGTERPLELRVLPYEEKQSDGSCKTRKIIVLASEPFDS